MRKFFDKEKIQNNSRPLTKDEIDRQKGTEEMSPGDKGKLLHALARRLLVDNDYNLESVINSDQSIWIMLTMDQKEEVVQNMEQILKDRMPAVNPN